MLTLHTVAVRWSIEFFQQKKQVKERYLSLSRIEYWAPSSAKKYRFQWTPIVFSPHNPKRMYVTSQVVHVTEDQGHSFEIISPDLSRNDPKTGETGGPITRIKQEQKYTLRYSPYQNHR
jgi:hypothetical protein